MGKGSREIDRIASEWLMHRDSGNWSEEDAARFETWLSVSTVHRVAFLRLERAWEGTRRLKALAAGIHSETPPPPGRWNLSPFYGPDVRLIVDRARSRSRQWRLAIAASVLVAAISAGVWYVWPTGQRYATPVGGLASVPMLDGSRVTLNTNSQIRVALTGTERRVDLKDGEAFFEVAKDPKRPFVVEAGRKRVVAVGTKFSVRRQGDLVEVVVTEGKVRVEDAALPLRISSSAEPGLVLPEGADGSVLLTAGSIARSAEDGVLIQHKTLGDAEAQLTWREGILTFRDETLADAIAEFNRYSARKIVITDPAVADLKIEGNFRSNNMPAFLQLIEAGFPVRVTEEPERIVLSSK